MKKIAPLLFLLCLNFTLAASVEPFYTTSKKALNDADSLIELSEYELAKEILQKVNENDTSYVNCQYKLAYVNYLDSSFEECALICRRNIIEYGILNYSFYNLLGLSFSEREDYDQAIDIFKKAISKYPTYYLYYYNLGNAHKEMEEYDKAIDSYKKSVELNPYYSSNYFQLGFILGSARKTTASSMAFHMYLLLNPTGSSAPTVISYLEDVIKGEQEWDEIEINDEIFPDYFLEIDVILENKIALNKKYKMKTDLEFQLMRQSQVMIEKIPEIQDTSFWHQKMGRLLSKIWSSKKFKGYSYYILDGLNNEDVRNMLQKNKSELSKFRDWAIEEIVPELSYRMMKDKKNYINIKSLLYSNNVLYGRGKYDRDKEENYGAWKYYHYNNRMTSQGSYKDGKREGIWEFYHENGVMKETGTYLEGKLVGTYEKFNDEGVKTQSYTYNEDSEIDGVIYFYSNFGCLDEELPIKKGLREGVSKLYFDDEHPKGVASYVADKQTGINMKLFYSGDTSEICDVGEEGYYDGLFRSYYDGKLLYSEGNYTDGDKDGNWKYFYRNGNKMEEGSFKKGKKVGTWKEYYEIGTLKSEKFLDESGKENGEVKKYDYDGILHEMYTYKIGIIMAYKYFNKQGELVDSYDKKSNVLVFKGYNLLGRVEVDGKFMREGRDDLWKFYDANGILSEDSYYEDGYSEGKRNYYHTNGKLKYIYELKQGNYHGIYEERDSYGHILRKGNYFNDELEGEYYTMDAFGDTLNRKYYQNGNLEGVIYYNDIDGKISYINTYKYGHIQKSIAFDDKGESIDTSYLDKGKGTIKYYNPNRVLNVKLNYSCGLVHGYTEYFNGLSEKTTEGEYLRGNKEGQWKWYNYKGSISTIGSFKKDDKNGRWLYYHDNGKLMDIAHYNYGEKVGVDTSYHDNGEIYIIESFRDGSKHGESVYYNRTGEIYMIKNYFEGDVIAVYTKKGEEIADKTELVNGNGSVVTYYENGNKAFSVEYKNGKYDGELLAYHNDGKLWKKMELVDGDLEGAYLEYHTNGKKSRITNYIFDEKNGLRSYYDEAGNIEWEVNYKSGDKHGEAKYYKAGKLERKVEYYEDQILFEY